MTDEIFISLKPEFAELISQRRKTHEFRKYKPKQDVRKIWIYVISPVAELRYIAEVGEPVAYPDKIPDDGIGNAEFNAGLKTSKYAFPILHLDELAHPLSYDELRDNFGFTAPQSFAYVDKYTELVKQVSDSELRRMY